MHITRNFYHLMTFIYFRKNRLAWVFSLISPFQMNWNQVDQNKNWIESNTVRRLRRQHLPTTGDSVAEVRAIAYGS